jgi:phage shock protein C
LTRPLAGRKLAGVCRGLANQYGWDVTLTRVIAVLLAILVFPIGEVAYVLFWVMVPEEPRTVAPTTNLNITT